MSSFKKGVILESFKTSLSDALDKAHSLGVDGFQVYGSRGELCYKSVTREKLTEFIKKSESLGLTVSALCGDLGMGFGNESQNAELIEASKRMIDMALTMGTRIVTTHIGVVPEDPRHPRYKIMQEACGKLAAAADSAGAHFAIETGPEPASVLKPFLDSLGSRGVSVNLDPANLAMVIGDDPVAAVYTLKDYIVHTHAKDGTLYYRKNPEILYGVCTEVSPTEQSFREVPLGTGDVDFPAYLKALTEIGYSGFLTVEREVGATPEADIKTAINFLNALTA